MNASNVSPGSDAPKTTGNPYHDPQLAAWLGSFEGVPDWPAAERQPKAATGGPMQRRAHAGMQRLGEVLPGAVLAVALAIIGSRLAQWVGVSLLGYENTPLSPVLAAILLGLVIRNTVGLPSNYDHGLRLCVKKILRIGIALLGIRMSFVAAGAIGLAGVPVVLGCIAAALVLVTWINRKLGLPRRLGSLIAVGTSICGVSAIVATSPVINADDDETSYAVATIALFGMVALFTYPFFAFWFFAGDAHLAGMFLGTAIHDTSQVAGAGLTYQQQFDAPDALNTAVVTKLVRNVCMAAVIPLMALLYHQRRSTTEDEGSVHRGAPSWQQMVPMFVLGFLAMTVLRTVGDMGDYAFGVLDAQTWGALIADTKTAATWCLAIAMGAVGLNTSLGRLKHLGWKPCVVGFAAALLVGAVSVALVTLCGPWVG